MKTIAKKKKVKDIVFDWLQALWDMDELEHIDYMEIHHLVSSERPESKFNPQHLALYKSQFLKEKRNEDQGGQSVGTREKDKHAQKTDAHCD